MSVSYFHDAFVEPDEECKNNLAVYLACEKAGVEIPEAVIDYFNHGEAPPDPHELEKLGRCVSLYSHPATTKDQFGNETLIDLSKLPPNTRFIRGYYSG